MSFDLGNKHFKWTVGTDGNTKTFVFDGKNYAAIGPIASVSKGGIIYPVSRVSVDKDNLSMEFGESGISAVVEVRNLPNYLTFEVKSVKGEGLQELTFLSAAFQLNGSLTEPLAVTALSLNTITNVPSIPGPSARVRASCIPRFGVKGAKVAFIGCAPDAMRTIMKQVIKASPEIPASSIGGPWAYDNKSTRGSYLFNFADMSENTVDDWIKMVKSIGITQIDFHGGTSFRFGDCVPNPVTYPNGRKSFKAVIDKLHAAGIMAGMHTYAFLIDKRSPWVTPVPDPGLAKDATFTLTSAISETDATVPVSEDTADMSTVIGFAVRNSVTLQIDDELIVYTGISKTAPYAFTGCTRGAEGTKPAPHAANAKVHHLKQVFSLFSPDPDSQLYRKMVQANADFYNECGFDMIYLDALDGEDLLGGAEYSWHYGSKFVFDLFRKLEKAPIMEMSTFHHHLWYVRSRMGAWDHANRSYKEFVDLHVDSNKACLNMFLPAHLGWWGVITQTSPHVEATYWDDTEYVLAKGAGWDCGLSPMVFTPETYASSYNLRRLGSLIKSWEQLRLAGNFTEAEKAKLREPGSEFTLVQEEGQPRIRRMQTFKHKVLGLEDSTREWSVRSDMESQPAKFRIVALTSLADYDAPSSVAITDFENTSVWQSEGAVPGASATIVPSTQEVKTGSASGLLTVDATKTANSKSAWIKLNQQFTEPRNLSPANGFGVWVYGDGKGEVLNFQLTSPNWLSSALADHYVDVDFTGWRYFEFVEPEGDRTNDYNWPYANSAYAIYRESVTYSSLQSLSIWATNLPADSPVSVYISPIKGLQLVSNKIVNPELTINGKRIRFPVEMDTNWYLEYNSPTDCKLYDAKGELISVVKPELDTPVLAKGSNSVSFSCAVPAQGKARAVVTLFGTGDLVEK